MKKSLLVIAAVVLFSNLGFAGEPTSDTWQMDDNTFITETHWSDRGPNGRTCYTVKDGSGAPVDSFCFND